MYKKKFRQWKFQTFRSGWDRRLNRGDPTAVSLRRLKHPEGLRLQELTFHTLCDEIRRGLALQLPRSHSPLTAATVGRQPFRLPLPTPDCLTIFQRSFGSGLDLMKTRKKASTWGALYEKAFEQVEPILRSGYVCTPIYFFDTLMDTVHQDQPAVRKLLLRYLNKMAIEIFSPGHALSILTKTLLTSSDQDQSMILDSLASSFTDAFCDVLGPLDYTSIATRMRALKIKSKHSTVGVIPLWEQVLLDAKRSPHASNSLIWNAEFYFADLAYTTMGDMQKTEENLRHFPAQLKAVRREDNLPLPETWVL